MHELQIGAGSVRLGRTDITTLAVDAIVNAANENLTPGGGVSGAIHRAGGPTIWAECKPIGHTPTGQAVITGGGNLPARYVIHAVGPIWRGGGNDEDVLLASAYRSSLTLAGQRGLASIAFPSISTGIYGFPLERAARIALGAVAEHLTIAGAPLDVTFALFSDRDLAAYEIALTELAAKWASVGGDGHSDDESRGAATPGRSH